MTILEVLEQVRELLRSKGRVSYNLLKTQFHLSSDDLVALQDELVEAEQVARDENGKVLVWVRGCARSKFNVPGSRSRRRTPNSELRTFPCKLYPSPRIRLNVSAQCR